MNFRVLRVFSLLSVLSCSTPSGAPTRPVGVPASALWIGGPDGGAFVRVDKAADAPTRVYDVVVYNDFTGDVCFKGRMRLSAPGELATASLRDPKFFNAWDGERLHLADGRYLAAKSP